MSDLKRRHIYEWLHLVETKIGTPTAASAARVLKEFYEGAEPDESTQPEATAPAPIGYVLFTGHGDKFSREKPACAVDYWKPVYLSPANALSAVDRVDDDATALLKRLKRDLMTARRYQARTLATYENACVAAESEIEEFLQSQKGGSHG